MAARKARLPQAGPPDSETSAAPEVPDFDLGPVHVLVVDDNEIDRQVGEEFCRLLGFSCEFARDGEEAVAAARAGRFDLIMMDICMPRMDGVEAARLIRQLAGPAGDRPIIAVTANADHLDVADYLAAGIFATVAKPIAAAKLFDAIGRALASRKPVRNSS